MAEIVDGNTIITTDLTCDPPVASDADGDCAPTLNDLQIVLDNYFITDPKPNKTEGNFNFDDTVNVKDFLIWRTEFLNAGGSLEGVDIFPSQYSRTLVAGFDELGSCRAGAAVPSQAICGVTKQYWKGDTT